jgi:ATP synthase protein I
MMFRVVLVQCVTSLIAAATAAAIAGSHAALTALLGGFACALPNGLFALNLALLALRRRSPEGDAGSAAGSALVLLVGEFFKVVLTAGLLALVVWGYKNVVWPALILTVGAVLLVQPVALAWRQHRAG